MEPGDNFASAAEKLQQEMVANGVEGVMVIADNVSNETCADTGRLRKYFKEVPKVWLVGSTSPFEPPARLEPFASLIKRGELVAMKLFPGHDKIYLNDDRYLSDIEFCDQYHIPLMIHTGVNTRDSAAAEYNDPKYIAAIAREYPNLKVVICHYFWPKLQYCFEQTEGLSNIHFDTSALADEEVVKMSGGWSVIKNILEKTLQRRAGSVMFGTDYPMCSVAEHLRLIRELDIDESARLAVLGLTAERLFGLK